MLLEFDADQRLWQETVRDAVGKQCPPALVRGVAEDGVDPTPVWKAYVEHGWTEMNESETAVELAIVLEVLGRATDPTPFLATMTQFAPLAADRFDPRHPAPPFTAGSPFTATARSGCWTAPRGTYWTAIAPSGWRW